MIPNLRDVAEAIELVCDAPLLQTGRLYRGGTVSHLFGADELPAVHTIVNLRRGPDPRFPGVVSLHVPAPDRLDNYETHRGRVRRWLNQAVGAVAGARWPVLIHCTAGRDRTGVVVAAILDALQLPTEAIRQEHALSTGVEDLSLIDMALAGLRQHTPYLTDPRIVATLREQLLPS